MGKRKKKRYKRKALKRERGRKEIISKENVLTGMRSKSNIEERKQVTTGGNKKRDGMMGKEGRKDKRSDKRNMKPEE